MTDIAGGLRPETVQQLNAMITSLEGATGIEIAVVVITSLEGQSVEEIPEKLFELWGIGKKGRENGLLLLWSTGDRRVRVEVGYGLEARFRMARSARFSTPTSSRNSRPGNSTRE